MRFRRYHGMWAPGMPMSAVRAEPVGPMLELAEELYSGRYRPQPPQRLQIAKASGGERELWIYMLRDRVAQRALLQVLQGRTDAAMAAFSFGYRPGRGVAAALARVRDLMALGLTWVVDADIERCFDSIPRAQLLREVARRMADEDAAAMIADYLRWDGADQAGAVGVPQGAVLSPWLCNVYLWRLDDHMQARGTAMVRFADDFVLLTGSPCQAEAARAECARLLSSLRLRLHPLKTAIRDASASFRFLGQQLKPTLRLASPAVLT